MSRGKRTRADMEDDSLTQVNGGAPSMLSKIRNMWEFASLGQFIQFFHAPMKIKSSEYEIEDLEAECLKPDSEKLSQLALSLLKFVSSHRGLDLFNFDEYTRRQYLAKAPEKNPFGDEETPKSYARFDAPTKIRILHQLSVWTFWNPDRIRGAMSEKESEQKEWRLKDVGSDAEGRTYFILDDDRLYRRTFLLPKGGSGALKKSPKPKAKPKPKYKAPPSRGSRASKRIKVTNEEPGTGDDGITHEADEAEELVEEEESDDGMKWECIAVSLQDYYDFIDSIRRSYNQKERDLRELIQGEIIPFLEKEADSKRHKEERKQRELENLERMATAKRSSRIAGRKERERDEERIAEEARKVEAERKFALKESERQRKMEKERESRMMTREQRLKDREVKRILHEQELAELEENSQHLQDTIDGRISERRLKAEIERRRQQLSELESEEEDWEFDCDKCGLHGANLDDGSHIIACEECNVWQHSACHNIAEEEAEKDDFHFRCSRCRLAAEAKALEQEKLPPLKLRFSSPAAVPGIQETHPSPRVVVPTAPSNAHLGITQGSQQPHVDQPVKTESGDNAGLDTIAGSQLTAKPLERPSPSVAAAGTSETPPASAIQRASEAKLSSVPVPDLSPKPVPPTSLTALASPTKPTHVPELLSTPNGSHTSNGLGIYNPSPLPNGSHSPSKPPISTPFSTLPNPSSIAAAATPQAFDPQPALTPTPLAPSSMQNQSLSPPNRNAESSNGISPAKKPSPKPMPTPEMGYPGTGAAVAAATTASPVMLTPSIALTPSPAATRIAESPSKKATEWSQMNGNGV